MDWCHGRRQTSQDSVDDEVPLSKKNPILHPVWGGDLMTISETHPHHTSQHSVILCYGYVLLFMLKILGTIKCAHAPFLFFFSSTRAQMHRHAQSHTHPLAHNTDTTFMPCDLARHYANGQTCHLPEISETEWESERKREREKFCTFVSLWELLVKSKYSSLHTLGTWDLAATVICNVVWCGGSRFWERKKKRATRDRWDLMWNCSKEHAMFTVHCLNSWKASWKARSEPKQPKSLTFQDS